MSPKIYLRVLHSQKKTSNLFIPEFPESFSNYDDLS